MNIAAIVIHVRFIMFFLFESSLYLLLTNSFAIIPKRSQTCAVANRSASLKLLNVADQNIIR